MKKESSERKAEIRASVIAKVKSLIFPVILCAIIVGVIIFVLNYKNAQEEEPIIRLNGYEGDTSEIVMENDKLKFVMDPTTTQFSLTVKSTGKVWYSNPQDLESDNVALPAEKQNLQSTLLMTYSKTEGLETKYNNYEYSIANSIYEIEQGDDYVRVNYSMGDVEREYIIPPVCTEENFDKWIGLMPKTYTNMVKQYYKKYDINKLSKNDKKNKDTLLANYPIMETEIIYVLRDNASASVRVKMEEYFAEVGYSMEDYQADKELDMTETTSDTPVYNVDMIYSLEGNDLVVKIPMNELEFKEDTPMYTVTPLPYFGAGNREQDGYLFVPEGGGAVIKFNNGKLSQNSYYANMYGWDMCLSRPDVVHSTRTYFNAFGIANDQDSFLCIMEEGVPYASVQADISGRLNAYNYANALYSICVRERYDVGDMANSAIYVYLEDLPDETLTQRYRFVDSSDYVDMAKSYGDYLQDKYDGYLTLNDDTDTPVAVEIVGAVDKVKQILGVPTSRPLELTSYKEAQEIVESLVNEGMKNMSVKMTGWANGGVKQKILKKVKTVSALGSKKDLQNMVDSAKSLGVKVYLDGITQYEYDSNLLNGFFSYRDAAKFITKERAELFVYSAVTYSAREGVDSYYLLHHNLGMQMMDNLVTAANKYGTGVSFQDTGKDLSSDYYRKNPVSRNKAMNDQSDKLKELKDAGQSIMINMGNDYAAVYSDFITNMDLRGSEYTIIDQFVPFYELAIHGYVNYAGEPINLSGHTEDEILRSAEYGAGLSFTLMKESAFTLQKTLYTEYYGSDYDAWHDRMMEIYNRYNSELGHTFNQVMTDHKILEKNLTCTTYKDGTKVYVNYDYDELTAPDGTKVPARDYKVVR